MGAHLRVEANDGFRHTSSRRSRVSKHASRRAQQRGIRRNDIDIVLDHADQQCWVSGGCQSLSISRGRALELKREGVSSASLDRARKVALVYNADDDLVVTVLHTYQSGRRGTRYRRQ